MRIPLYTEKDYIEFTNSENVTEEQAKYMLEHHCLIGLNNHEKCKTY